MKIRRVKAGEVAGFPAPSAGKGAGWIPQRVIEPGFIIILSQIEAATGGLFVSDRELLDNVDRRSKLGSTLGSTRTKKRRAAK